jgi:hypothetical protein
VIVATGATVSTVHVKVAGADVFPASSVAVATNVCGPSARGEYVVQAPHPAGAWPSSWQVNVPSSLEEMLNVADVLFVGSFGEDRIETTGGVASELQAYVV